MASADRSKQYGAMVNVTSAETIVDRSSGTRHRWLVWGGAAVVILAGSLWYGAGRSDGVSAPIAVADCAYSVPSAGPPQGRNVTPTVVGLGSASALIAFDASGSWRWCYITYGNSMGGGSISSSEMRSALAAPVAVVDGGLKGDVLLLVHLAKQTTSVVVTTARSRSFVIAKGGGFDVLRIPMAKWPHWHAPWSRVPISLGRIMGFDAEGQVTASQPFTWCPGVVNSVFGRRC